MAARKSWEQYSHAYRQRLQRHGINESNYRTASRTRARGHEFTPERPSQVYNRDRIRPEYVDYANEHRRLARQVILKKDRLWGSTLKWNVQRAERNVHENPAKHIPPTMAEMKRFLAMSSQDVIDIDWANDDWAFLFYH